MDYASKLRSWPRWPEYGPEELVAVTKVLKSNQLFAASEVQLFEQQFADFQESEFAVGIGNATQGLHLALAALDIGKDDEVIVTPCSWISSVSCILMQNAVPVFSDIESDTLGLDPKLIEAKITPRTKAIMLVHIIGYPARADEVAEIARNHSLILVEDASHAPGATLNGRKMGTFGEVGVFSLQQRKAISTGDGGVISTNNKEVAEKIRRLRSFGHDELSYNYRMSEFSAVLGQIGLSRLEAQNLERERCANYLASLLKDEDWARVRLESRTNATSVYYAIGLELNISDSKAIELLEQMITSGIPARKMFSPLHLHPHFRSKPAPARGLPWRNTTYDGFMKERNYEDLSFPIAQEYCNGRILELYVHPPTSFEHLEAFAEFLRITYHNLVEDDADRRVNW